MTGSDEKTAGLAAAYSALVGDVDPARGWLDAGAPDERFGLPGVPGAVYRGPNDLRELRKVVERVTGPGSWPAPTPLAGECVCAKVVLERPADVMGLVMALTAEIDDRSAMWRTWKTAFEAIARAAEDLGEVTVEACRASTV